MEKAPRRTVEGEGRPVRVGIGLIRREDRLLVRPRPPGSIMAGYWEFPGGKAGAGELPEATAARECLEELGIPVRLHGLRSTLRHRYPHGWIELFYYDGTTTRPGAEPDPRSGFIWVHASHLLGLPFLEANGPILASLAAEFPGQA